MLSIGTIGRPGYFLDIASSEYYRNGGERPGEWLVASGSHAKFDGEVAKDALNNVMAGRSRDGQRQLVQAHPKRKKGWDLTFSVPKSVSVLYALAPKRVRDEILQAHRQAIEVAVQYVLREAVWARRGKGGSDWEKVDKAFFSCFTHISSRAGDPDLHDHVLLANLAQRFDGTTGAIWSRELYKHTHAIGAVYRVELAHQLQQRLGVVVYRVRAWFELRGIPQTVCQHFSQRSEKIREVAREFGESHPKFLELVTKLTRGVKGHLPHKELLADWKARAVNRGLAGLHIANMLNIWRPQLGDERARRTAYVAASQAIDTLSEKFSYFTEKQIIQAATPYVMGKGRGADLLFQTAEIAKRELITLDTPGERYAHFTTLELYNTETRLIRMAATYGRQQGRAWLPFSEALRVVDKAYGRNPKQANPSERAERLSAESALRYLVSSKQNIRLLAGIQGSGKTSTLRLVKQAYERAGHEVICCAPTTAATAELRRTVGGNCVTVQKLLDAVSPSTKRRLSHAARQAFRLVRGRRPWRRDERKLEIEQKPAHYYRQVVRMLKGKMPQYAGKLKLTKNTVILLDEAQKLDTRTAERLLKIVEKRGCTLRIAYTKDSPTGGGPGGVVEQLAQQLGAHELKPGHFLGQAAWQRDAHRALREGDSKTFLKKYRRAKSLKETPTLRRAIKAIAKAWAADKKSKPREKLVIASDPMQVDKLNKAIQKARKGVLPNRGAKMPTGDVVRRGDRVRFNANSRSLGVDAGELGRVMKVKQHVKNPSRKQVWVRVDDRKRFGLFPKVVVVDTKYYKKLKLGYALLPGQVQEKVKHAFVLLNGTKASRESVLHQVTRATHKTKLFAVKSTLTRDVDLLAQQLAQSQRKIFAHELENQRQQQARGLSFGR